MLGIGFTNFININVTSGNKINCEIIPVNTILGFLNSRLKSSNEMPSATPNIINARVIFNTQRPSALKFIFRESKFSFILIFKCVFNNISSHF